MHPVTNRILVPLQHWICEVAVRKEVPPPPYKEKALLTNVTPFNPLWNIATLSGCSPFSLSDCSDPITTSAQQFVRAEMLPPLAVVVLVTAALVTSWAISFLSTHHLVEENLRRAYQQRFPEETKAGHNYWDSMSLLWKATRLMGGDERIVQLVSTYRGPDDQFVAYLQERIAIARQIISGSIEGEDILAWLPEGDVKEFWLQIMTRWTIEFCNHASMGGEGTQNHFIDSKNRIIQLRRNPEGLEHPVFMVMEALEHLHLQFQYQTHREAIHKNLRRMIASREGSLNDLVERAAGFVIHRSYRLAMQAHYTLVTTLRPELSIARGNSELGLVMNWERLAVAEARSIYKLPSPIVKSLKDVTLASLIS